MSSRARCPLFEASGHTNLAIALGIVSALQLFFDGSLGIQHGVGPGKRNASPRFGCMEKDDPFPANGFVTSMISNWMPLYSMAVPRSAGTGRRVSSTFNCSESTFARTAAVAGCPTTAKVTIGTASPTRLSLQCLSSSSPNTVIQKHIESILRYLLQSDLPSPITSNQVEHFE